MICSKKRGLWYGANKGIQNATGTHSKIHITHSDNNNSTNNNNRFERISVPFLSLFSIAILQMLVKHFIFFVHLNSYLSTSFTYYYIVVVHGILLNVPKCCNIKIILLLKLLLYNHHYIIHMKKHTPCIQYTWYY